MTALPIGPALLALLESKSGLPGPRPNLEYILEFAQIATAESVTTCLEVLEDTSLAADSPREFIGLCAVVGAGAVAARGGVPAGGVLRKAANHPLIRLRDAAVTGLVQIGKAKPGLLWEIFNSWENSNFAEKRAMVCALCDETFLQAHPVQVEKVLKVCNELLEDMDAQRLTKSEDFKSLRKAMGIVLSVPVTLQPELGKACFEHWSQLPSPEVRWVLNENLKKSRMVKMDRDWVQQQIEFLNDAD